MNAPIGCYIENAPNGWNHRGANDARTFMAKHSGKQDEGKRVAVANPDKSSEPTASKDKFFTMKELRAATLAHCVAWWEWQWRGKFTETAFGLGYSRQLSAWPNVQEAESEARLARSQLNVYIREALVIGQRAEESAFTGAHCEALRRAAPHLKAAVKAMSAFAWIPRAPVIEPSRRQWLSSIVAPRLIGSLPGQVSRIEDLQVDALAIYALIAGFFPKISTKSERLPISEGITIRRVLGEERKNVRSALNEFIEEQQRQLDEWNSPAVQAEVEAIAAKLRSDGKA